MTYATAASTILRPRIATSALFLANGIGIGAWAGVLPALQKQLELSNTEISAALVAFASGAVVAIAFATRLAGRFGVHRTTLAAAIVFALALALPPLAVSLSALAGAGLLLGLSNGLLDVGQNTNAADVERAARRPIMSSFHAVFSLGGMLGALGIGLALRMDLGVATGMMVAATATGSLVALSLVLGLRRGLRVVEAVARAESWRWPDRAVVGVGALTFLALLVEGALADWSGLFMTEVAGASVAGATTAYAAFAIAMVLGRTFGDWTVDRWGAARVLRAGAAAPAAAIALAICVPQPNVVRFAFALSGLGLSNLAPVLFSAGARVKPERPEEGMAGAVMGGYAGFLFGPAIIGFAAHLAGLRLALLLLVVAAIVLSILAPRAAKPVDA